ncbi:MAG TPA: Ig-like domain-containing protein [Pseudonocardiaceae bacterium]|nr:Ig-like domain-containing protein [Pseudonocardiaceae bacterium]
MVRPRSRLTVGAVGLFACAVLLAGCTSGGSGNAGGSGGGSGGGGSTSTTTPNPMSISVTPAASEQANPTTPIVVTASQGTLGNVVVTNPASGNQVTGQYNADKTTWTSTDQLRFGAAYQVDATGTSRNGQPTEQKATVNTLKPAATLYPNMVPAPSTPSVGVGQIIAVKFDKPIVNKAAVERNLKVTSTPAQVGGWSWISSTEVHYRPQVYWQANSTVRVQINLFGVDLGGGDFGEANRDVTYHIHDSWVAKADGNTEQMQIFHNGALVNTLPISMGKDATPTHIGAHVISFKQNPYVMNSCTYGVCSGPQAYVATEYWAERISNDGEFVHENPNSVPAQGHTNVSHGCINLSPQSAQWFFGSFDIGDVVEVTNSGGPPLPVYDTWGDWELSWSQWQAGSALN